MRLPPSFRRAARLRRRRFAGLRGGGRQEVVFLAFGDSITEGYGDTSSLGGGYPSRLERWLRQEGYDAIVENHGVGGETTSSGLSRIDSVLAGGGDYLLLMEGTNDISRRASVETIAFNLDEMAARAEALDIIAVHATVIPRIPTAPVDASNAATSALAQSDPRPRRGAPPGRRRPVHPLRGPARPSSRTTTTTIRRSSISSATPTPTATSRWRASSSRPCCRCSTLPPSRSFRPRAPSGPASSRLFGLEIAAIEQFVHVEWDFGDGGFASTPPPDDLTAFYIFLHPGTYTVSVRGLTAEGAVAEDSVQVIVEGGEPAWQTASSVLPVVVESNDGQIVTDLLLINSSSDFAVAEVAFLPEITYDAPLQVRRFILPLQSTTTLREVLSSTFGVGTGRGALRITFYALPQSSTSFLSARALVRSASDPDGSDGATVNGIPETNWSAAAKHIAGHPPQRGFARDARGRQSRRRRRVGALRSRGRGRQLRRFGRVRSRRRSLAPARARRSLPESRPASGALPRHVRRGALPLHGCRPWSSRRPAATSRWWSPLPSSQRETFPPDAPEKMLKFRRPFGRTSAR